MVIMWTYKSWMILNSFVFAEFGNEDRGYRAQPCAESEGRRVALEEYFGRRPKGDVLMRIFFIVRRYGGVPPYAPDREMGR
jgi:hypothetical protein